MDTPTSSPKIAILHDFCLKFGGAERVLLALTAAYPEAPVYTLLSEPDFVHRYLPNTAIRTSFLQKLPPFIRRRYRWLLPWYGAATEAFDLRDYQVVVSSSGAWTKGVVTRVHTPHIAYIHSPFRPVWDYNETYLRVNRVRGTFRLFTRMLLSYLRLWDFEAAQRPDTLLANSVYTQARIAKYYRRESTVLTPPVFTLGLPPPPSPLRQSGSFLCVARASQTKELAVVVAAFRKLSLPLRIVGGTRAGIDGQVHHLGQLSDAELQVEYLTARALIHPVEEDYGLAVAEALAVHLPVVTLGSGGATELVTAGVTGEFFDEVKPESIALAVKKLLDHEQQYHFDGLPRFQSEVDFIREIHMVVDSYAKA